MATMRIKKIVKLNGEWKPHQDDGQNGARDAFVCGATTIEEGKQKQDYLMVYSQRIAAAITEGESYEGHYIPPIKKDGKDYYLFKITATENPSLQKEGETYGGGSSHGGGGGGSSSGGGGGGGYAAPSSAQYSMEELALLYSECYDKVLGVMGGDVGDDAVAAATSNLFDAARESGCKATPPAAAPKQREETRAAPSQEEYRGDAPPPFDDGGVADDDNLPF